MDDPSDFGGSALNCRLENERWPALQPAPASSSALLQYHDTLSAACTWQHARYAMAALQTRLQLQLEEARGLARYAQVGDIQARPRDFASLLAAADRMAAPATQDTDATAPHVVARAQRLLGSTGFDVDAALPPLLQPKPAAAAVPRVPAAVTAAPPPATVSHAVTDVSAYISSLHNACVASCTAEAASHAAAHVAGAASLWQREEWERSKATLMSALGLSLPIMADHVDTPLNASINATRATVAQDAPVSPSATPASVAGGVYALGEGEGDVKPTGRMHPYAAALASDTAALAVSAHTLRAHVHATSGGRSHRIIQAYTAVAEEAQEPMDAAYSGMSVSQRSRVWMLLAQVVGEGDATPAHAFAPAYGCETTPPSQPSRDVAMHWAAASLQYLASLYRHVIETYVEAGATGGGGGGGNTLTHVMSYVRMMLDAAGGSEARWYSIARETHACIGDVPLWPCVYMCVRMGEMHAARDALTKALAMLPPAMRETRDFIRVAQDALDAYSRVYAAATSSAEHRDAFSRVAAAADTLTTAHLTAIAACATTYVTQSARKDEDDFDPWMAATFCVLAGAACSPVHADGIAVSSTRIIDAVWHTLWCVLTSPLALRSVDAVHAALTKNPSARAAPASHMPLRSGWDMHRAGEPFRNRPSTWDADGSRAYALAEALLCVAAPEHAVAHLCNHGARSTTSANPVRALCDGLHIALALAHYGLLHVHLSGEATPVRDTASLVVQYPHSAGVYALDMQLLLTTYMSAVCAGVPSVCLDYASLLSHGPTRVLACARIITSTRAFTRLCGPLQVSGGVAHGALSSSHVSTHGAEAACVDTREVIDIVAAAARTCGDAAANEDAIALYLRIPDGGGVTSAAELALRACERIVDAPLRGDVAVSAARTRLRSLAEVVCATGAAHGAGEAPAVVALNVSMYVCAAVDSMAAVGPAAAGGSLDEASRANAERSIALLDACDILPHSQDEDAWARVFDPRPVLLQHAIVRILPHALRIVAALYEDAKAAAAHSVGATSARVTLQQLIAAADGTSRAPTAGMTAECVHAIRVAAGMHARAQAIVTGYTPALRRAVPSQVHSQMTLAVSQLR